MEWIKATAESEELEPYCLVAPGRKNGAAVGVAVVVAAAAAVAAGDGVVAVAVGELCGRRGDLRLFYPVESVIRG